MLIGIPVVLTPDLLRHLSAMGHGDELIIVDVNFPAEACADRVERLAGVTASEALTAILSVLPLDSYDDARPARCKLSMIRMKFLTQERNFSVL